MNENKFSGPAGPSAARSGPTRFNAARRSRPLAMIGCWLTLLFVCLVAQAYPPSPYHLIYGLVRDQYGTPIMNQQVQILIVATNGTRNSTSIQPALAAGVNYQLEVPLDTLLKPDLYRTNALPAGAGFQIFVVVGNVTNVPMVSIPNPLNLGQPTKLTQIDLTLGTDSNNDGIPDAWEQAFLDSIGSNLTLAQLNAGLVFGGRTLWQHYLMGTYPFDPENPFAVRLVNYNSGLAVLEFPTMTGRAYSVQSSTNLQQWSPVSFRLSAEGPGGVARTNYVASVIELLQVQVIQSNALPKQFFRINLQ